MKDEKELRGINPRILLIGALLCIMLVAGFWFVRVQGADLTPERMRSMLTTLGIWGPMTLILALAFLLVIPLVPATLFQIGAGLAFGPLPALVYTMLADGLGASIGFWIARRWGSKLIQTRISEQQRSRLARLAQRVSWRSMLLLRLLPGPAYPLVSFAAGYSSMSYRAYLLSSLVGVFPSLALLTLAGDLVTRSPLLAFGIVAAFLGLLALAGRWLKWEQA